MLKPYNDTLLVEISKSKWETETEDAFQTNKPEAIKAKVIATPELKDVFCYSSYVDIAAPTVFNHEVTDKLYKQLKSLQGKVVYIERLSDKGTTIVEGDKVYCCVKLAKVICVEE